MIITHPTELNWFYESFSIRIERELTELGHRVRRIPAVDLAEQAAGEKRILIVNLLESHAAAQKNGLGKTFLNAVRSVPERVLINYDSIQSHWFQKQIGYEQDLITHIIDVSIASQESDYQGEAPYYWLPETLEQSAENYLSCRSQDNRPLPWCVIGHAAKSRAILIHSLIQRCSLGGFVYVPGLQPFGAHGGLDQERLHRVLTASDLFVWNSYHAYAYHEGLRALHAVAAGAAPAKIDPRHHHRFARVPWVYPSVEAMAQQKRNVGADMMWRQALDFFKDRASLGKSLEAILNQL